MKQFKRGDEVLVDGKYDGVIHDTHDCSRAGTRCVYGYYSLSNHKPKEG